MAWCNNMQNYSRIIEVHRLITIFDIETSFQMIDGKPDPSPKHPDNFIVSIGMNEEYFFFKHNQYDGEPPVKRVQEILNKTTLLVGHNIKFDLAWIYEAGFSYSGKIYDTMIGEYVLGRGMKKSLKLKDCCSRRGVSKKLDITEQYIKDGVSFEKIPFKVVDEYGRQDIIATTALFKSQMADFKLPRNKGLLDTVRIMCKFCAVLTQMENNGIYIDTQELNKVEKEFQIEYSKLRIEIDTIIHEKMGDTKINPASPEQLSMLIYGTKILDKREWIQEFNIGIDKYTRKPKKRPRMTKLQFQKALMMHVVPVYKTKAIRCGECIGKGYIQKIKVNGEPYKNLSKCRLCNSKNFSEVIRIDDQYLSPTFVKTNEGNSLANIKVPHTLVFCNDCNLLQLRETVNPDLLYKQYFYRSAVSDTMRNDLKKVVEDVSSRVKLDPGDCVVDIGANDCTMISYFSDNKIPNELKKLFNLK